MSSAERKELVKEYKPGERAFPVKPAALPKFVNLSTDERKFDQALCDVQKLLLQALRPAAALHLGVTEDYVGAFAAQSQLLLAAVADCSRLRRDAISRRYGATSSRPDDVALFSDADVQELKLSLKLKNQLEDQLKRSHPSGGNAGGRRGNRRGGGQQQNQPQAQQQGQGQRQQGQQQRFFRGRQQHQQFAPRQQNPLSAPAAE